MSTGLRVGFLSAPKPLVPSIERAIRATTWNTPAVMAALACRWLDDGAVDRLENDKRTDARVSAVGHPSSYFLWLPLPEDVRPDAVAAALAAERASVATAEPFATTAHVPRAIRLALGSTDLRTLRGGARNGEARHRTPHPSLIASDSTRPSRGTSESHQQSAQGVGMIGTIIGAIIVGLIVGGLARLVMPGKQNIGTIMTIVLGAIGSFLGTWVAYKLGYSNQNGGFKIIPFLVGVVFAALLIAGYLGITGRRGAATRPRT